MATWPEPAFLTTLVVSPAPDAKRWRVEAEFRYRTSHHLGSQQIAVVPSFMTDFASVPFPLTAVFPKWGKYGWAAVVHDWIYSQQMYSKEYADDVFREAMRVSRVPEWKVTVFYLAVSWFGFFAWYSAAAKIKAGMSKFDRQGGVVPATKLPNWSLPPTTHVKGVYEAWKFRPKRQS